MAYSFSFDASLKLTTASNLAGFLNHFAREENEIDMNHSNENIDPSRTDLNRTYVYDAEKGCMVRSTSHEQIMDAMRASIDRAVDVETATYRNTGRAIRKDAVLAYGLIMQIDPQFYKDNKDNSKLMAQSYVDMIQLAQKRFGKENIVAVSLHLDEVNPHLHFIMTPVTDDNRLSSKDFINSPKLKQMHGEFRKELREKGYDIDLERRTPLNAKRLSEKDYKELQKSQDKLKELEEQEKALLEAECQQNAQAYAMASVSFIYEDREKELAEREKAIAQSETRLQDAVGEFKAFSASEREKIAKHEESLLKREKELTTPKSELEMNARCMILALQKLNMGNGKNAFDAFYTPNKQALANEIRENDRRTDELLAKCYRNNPNLRPKQTISRGYDMDL
ncbi:MAG: MobV family relaxase [Acetatifactor sp.]